MLQLANQQLTENDNASPYFYCLYSLSFPDYLPTCPLNVLYFEKFWENLNIRRVLENIFLKRWKFGENFLGILEWLRRRRTLNIFTKCRKNFKKLLEKLPNKCCITFGKIMRKRQSNFILLIFLEITKKYWKCFFEILVKLWRKFETWEILCTIYSFRWKFCDIFWSIFGRTYEELSEKYEKYFTVPVSS